MLPWVSGFRWDAEHVIFLGIFYLVVIIIASAVIKAMLGSHKVFKTRKQEEILWKANFEELPQDVRTCRHVIDGLFERRICNNGFDCRDCETHAKLISETTQQEVAAYPRQEQQTFGLNISLDRLYHRGHTWAKPETDGSFTIGLDDLGARLIGTPDKIILPAVGAHIKANGTGWRIKKNKINLRILSPLDGEVIEIGSPDETGWYLRVKPTHGAATNMRHLLQGAEIFPWVAHEVGRLKAALASRGASFSFAATDGSGEGLSQCYSEADWDAVLGNMFLES
jgi:glycine cleavage system H lipoate-binding protein